MAEALGGEVKKRCKEYLNQNILYFLYPLLPFRKNICHEKLYF